MSAQVQKPMSEIRKELRIKWYRCPIDPTVLRELSKPSDFQGFQMALGHLGLWLLTGAVSFYFAVEQLWLGFLLTIFLHGTVGTFFSAPHHELCHGTVFKTKRLNEIFLRIFSTLGLQNFHIYKMSHSYHHRFTLHRIADKEVVLPKTPSLRFLYLLQLFTFNITGGFESRGLFPTMRGLFRVAADRMEQPYNEWGAELYAEFPEERLKAVHWARYLIAVHLSFALFAVLIGYPILILIVSLHPFIGNWLRYFVGAPMHCGLQSDVSDFRKCVRSITLDPISEFLYWHMNWHLEHHMFAAVPCYNLKKLYEAVAEDMPQPRTLISSWQEMLEVVKQQEADPAYEFDTLTPLQRTRREKEQQIELEASIGDLAPTAIA
ncbi:MAG: fatty acid desaturase [Deltaproteobacteria bacterium]|nr:fatty acid desaturase [Deltaproteobacteria bacterium]